MPIIKTSELSITELARLLRAELAPSKTEDKIDYLLLLKEVNQNEKEIAPDPITPER